MIKYLKDETVKGLPYDDTFDSKRAESFAMDGEKAWNENVTKPMKTFTSVEAQYFVLDLAFGYHLLAAP